MNIDGKSAFLKEVGQFQPKFQASDGKGIFTTNHFAPLDRPVNALQMPYPDYIHTKKLCSKLSSSKVHYETENDHFTFLSSQWGLKNAKWPFSVAPNVAPNPSLFWGHCLRTTYAVHLGSL